jgi:spermidine synthase
LAGGFGLLPWLSATGAWQCVAIVLVALGATAVVLSALAPGTMGRLLEKGVRPLFLAAQVALVALTITLVRATGPTAVWRHSAIGAGRASADVLASTNQRRGWMNVNRRAVVWEADGIESGVSLIKDPTGYAFMLNGKSDGSARGDAGTQVMLGLLGALARPDARRALVIGLGTGSTAGWLGAVPSIDRVDVIELEPLVLEVARASTPVNHDVLTNPKVLVTIGDAREMLLTTRDRYDIIASEPSNPYRAGVASLFTLEFYRAAADRLTADGVFAQWVQGYEIDAPTLRTIYATLGAVFEQVETWQTTRADFVLVASKRRQTYRARDLAGRMAEEPFKSALAQSWRAVDVHGLLAHFVADDAFARQIARASDAGFNTDDRNIVEFGLARLVGRTIFMLANMRNAARSAGAARPPLEDSGEVRWPEVETAVVSYNASEGSFLDTRYQGPPNEQARQAALVEYYQNNNLVAARDFWQQQPDPPRDPTEMAMLADIAANSGSDTALPFIDRLRAFQPAEADTILATLRLRQLKLTEAADALEAALMRLRTDPWPIVRFKERAIQLAAILASRDSSLARRMFDGLGQPFALRAIEDVRLITRAEMTRQVDFGGLCANAVGTLEPHVPWAQTFLRLRGDCYQASNDPRATMAARDLNEYVGNLPQPLVP